jgi:Derlin-1
LYRRIPLEFYAMANDISDWFKSIPLVSRYWFSACIILPLLGRIGLLSPMYMILLWDKFVYSFQLWRPLTAVFYYPITPQTGFHYLINLYFLYSYSTRIETGTFDGRPADYLFLLVFNWIVLVIIGFIGEFYLLFEPMILSVMYVWCQLNRDQIVQFWFGTQFKAIYLPWVLVLFNLILRGGGLTELIGILVGHLYFFIMFKYPQDYGGRVLFKTPSIFYRFLPNRVGGISGFGMPRQDPRRQNDGDARPRFPGRGYQLGRD